VKRFLLLLLLFPIWMEAVDPLQPVLSHGRYRPIGIVEEPGQPLDGWEELAGKPYLEATGKQLYYPTRLQLQLELALHRSPPLPWLIGGYCVAALLYLFRWKRTALSLLLTTWAFHLLLIAVRSFILGRPPVANMEESLLWAPWVAVTASLFLGYRGAAGVAAALSLLVAGHFRAGLEPVQAVLDSQLWLSIHVLLVVGSYGLFLLAGVMGHLYLLRGNVQVRSLVTALYLGTGMLIAGTLLGGVWAAQSWGRFWDWDPKEAWAFISICVYLFWIHAYYFGLIGPRGLAIGSIVGLVAITFTWYGVNFLLGTGLHSYGFGSGGEIWYFGYIALEGLFLGWQWVKRFRTKVL
jgi:ABC-type transport system involved in cytochrome c biogenesis permease subunit